MTRRHRRRLRAVLVVAAAVPCLLAATLVGSHGAAGAGTNLVNNPGLETVTGSQPSCFSTYGWGSSTITPTYLTTAANSHAGTHAMQLKLANRTSGDYKVMSTQSTACAPAVTAGNTYTAGVYYKSTTASIALTAFTYSPAQGWQYWTELNATTKTTTAWALASADTPAVPAGVTAVTFGISISGNGTLVTDDYSLVQKGGTSTPTPTPTTTTPTPTPTPTTTTATATPTTTTATPTGTGTTAPGGTCTGTPTQCTKGEWTVLPFPNHVRTIHTVVLNNGKILFMAGSGNDQGMFGMHDFRSTVWDPIANTWTDIQTPDDVFCSGHVQLPNGNVLIMGGNKDYPTGDGRVGYKGLKSSYIFNIQTMAYQRVNDMNTGHWYPSATVLGNGNVFSMGGLDETSAGTVTNEMFDNTTQKWLPLNQVPQQWNYFGLYPSNILTAGGKLFYSGSHVFGNQGNPNGPGAYLIDLTANTLTAVTGLQSPNQRDQSAAVLLPPAQSQRVMVMGGGNVDTNVTANRYTDLINLNAANPSYTPGPLLPQGSWEAGNTSTMQMSDPSVQPETGSMGKMYVSAVVLPDRTVLETGGALHNRADPVYEASSYNPTTNAFTPMAVDPVERGYHSQSVLYQDGTVISAGSNPGDASFDMRISVYRPPYMFWTNRPTLDAPATQWDYGTTQPLSGSDGWTSAELIKPAAVTHSSDPNQRLVDLPLTRTAAGTYQVTLTGNPNLAPPGWYMLFVQNANGPSSARWVHVGGN